MTAAGGRPPALGLFLLEGQRAVLERLALGPSTPLLRLAPRGDGQPVLVLPGFTAGDASTRVLRRFLRRQGFAAHPWLLGRNLGPEPGIRSGLVARIDELARRYGRKVSIVGWSLGGIYAREIAKRKPDRIRQVVTLGSPFADTGRASNVSRLFDLVAGGSRPRPRAASGVREAPPMPSSAIFSKTDSVVHWRSCIEPEGELTESIEVSGSHCGLGFNPLVLFAVADRLSQPEGAWRPFDVGGWRSAAYATHRSD